MVTIHMPDRSACVSCVINRISRMRLSPDRPLRAAEDFYSDFFKIPKPVAYAPFWHTFPDILAKVLSVGCTSKN